MIIGDAPVQGYDRNGNTEYVYSFHALIFVDFWLLTKDVFCTA